VSSEIEHIILVAAGTAQSDGEVLIVTAVQGLTNPDGGSRFDLATCCRHPHTTESLNQKCILVTKHSHTSTCMSTSRPITTGVEKNPHHLRKTSSFQNEIMKPALQLPSRQYSGRYI